MEEIKDFMFTNKNYNLNDFDLSKAMSKGLSNVPEIEWLFAKDNFIKIKNTRSRILDFTSGILSANIGHNNNKIKKYLKKTINQNLIHSYNYSTNIKKEYFYKLKQFSADSFLNPFIYLTSSGTEATETCLKLMLRDGLKKNKNKILTIRGNYHGRTAGSSLMGNGNIFIDAWPQVIQNFPKIDFPYSWKVSEKEGEQFFLDQISSIDNEVIESIAGVLLETFQGWCAGMYPKSFVKAIETFCKEKEIILAFDEMQAGFYRTGMKFGFQNYDVNAQLICVGKGMGGGLPLSGVIGEEDIMNNVLPGELSSTHSANPLCCAGGNAVLDVMTDKNFLKELKMSCKAFEKKGYEVTKKYKFLKKKSFFKGMVGAIIFDNEIKEEGIKEANKFCEIALNKGLLVIKTGLHSVKLAPPLSMKKKYIEKGFNIIDNTLDNMYKN